MQSQANQQLLEEIKAFKLKGEPIDKMTTALIAAGWSEEDINLALFEVNNQPAVVSLDPNQEAVIAMSNAAADDQYDDLSQETILDGMAGSMGPSPISGYYQAKFYDDIGVGWWSTHALDLGAAALAYHFRAPWLYLIVSIAVLAHIVYSTYKVIWWRRHRRNIN